MMDDRSKLTTADLASAGSDANARPTPESKPRDFEPGRPDPYAPPAPVAKAAVPPLDSHPALLPNDELDRLREQWQTIQTEFVDEPRRAVEQADHLVAATVQRLAESFARERNTLEEQWSRGSDVSTEDLRQALRRYRSFFDRLLTI